MLKRYPPLRMQRGQPLHWHATLGPLLSSTLHSMKKSICGRWIKNIEYSVHGKNNIVSTYLLILVKADCTGEWDRPRFCEELGEEFAEREP